MLLLLYYSVRINLKFEIEDNIFHRRILAHPIVSWIKKVSCQVNWLDAKGLPFLNYLQNSSFFSL